MTIPYAVDYQFNKKRAEFFVLPFLKKSHFITLAMPQYLPDPSSS
jgi:hypothetical protein